MLLQLNANIINHGDATLFALNESILKEVAHHRAIFQEIWRRRVAVVI